MRFLLLVTTFIAAAPAFSQFHQSGVSIVITEASCESKGTIAFQSANPSSYSYSIDNSEFTALSTYDVAAGNHAVSILNRLTGGYCDTVVDVLGEQNAVFIPNTFSSSCDMYYDKWKIYSTCIESLECSIYNRWGELVFRFTNPEDGWDGSYNGGIAPEGTYFYVAGFRFISGEKRECKGSVYMVL